MDCPDCGHENIPGSEICDDCGHDLAGLDLPTPTSRLQEKIMFDPLENLHPAPPLIVSPDSSVEEAVQKMNEQMIEELRQVQDLQVEAIFNIWLKNRNKKDLQIENTTEK